MHLHFESFPGPRYGRRILLQAVLTGSQDAISEINVDIHIFEIDAKQVAIRFGQAVSKRHEPFVFKVPIAHGEILENAKTVRYLLLNPHHTIILCLRMKILIINDQTFDQYYRTHGVHRIKTC